MTCQTCKYWTAFKGSKEKGQCRRFSPEVVPETDGGGIATLFFVSTDLKTKWPETLYDDWCGEYESKQAPEPKKTGTEIET